MPKLSIIIPTYNSEATLGRALESIVNQTFTDWEVLIMDGRSKDRTLEVAAQFNDDRIRVYSEQDKGVYDAMNKGISKSKGEWIYFLGSDDWLLNDNVLAKVLGSNIDLYDVVYGEAEYYHLGKEFHGEWTLSNVFVNRCHQAILYRKRILQKYNGYNLRYKTWADYDLNLKWFFDRKVKKKYIGVNIAHFSEGGCSDGSPDVEFEKDKAYIYLVRGGRCFSRSQRIQLAKKAIFNTDSLLKRISLRFILIYWLLISRMSSISKYFILRQ